MPEIPDLVVYLDQLSARIAGRALRRVRTSPSPRPVGGTAMPSRKAVTFPGNRVPVSRRIGQGTLQGDRLLTKSWPRSLDDEQG